MRQKRGEGEKRWSRFDLRDRFWKKQVRRKWRGRREREWQNKKKLNTINSKDVSANNLVHGVLVLHDQLYMGSSCNLP